MTAVKCPLCGEWLKDGQDLNICIGEHMSEVHGLQDLCILDKNGRLKSSLESCDPAAIRGAKGLPHEGYDRPVFEYSVDDQLEHMSGPSTQERKRMERIRCPLCGLKVEGTDDLDLSDQFLHHFSSEHIDALKKGEKMESRDLI